MIIAIVGFAGSIAVVMGSGLMMIEIPTEKIVSEDIDLEKIRYINDIDSCTELKEEYQLIKQYDSVLEHSDLYLKAIATRADEIMPGQAYCNLEN